MDEETFLKNALTPNESLYDLLCSLMPFAFSFEDSKLNEIFLFDECLTEHDFLEIYYSSPDLKTSFINILVSQILLQNSLTDELQSETLPPVVMLYIDAAHSLNLRSLHALILHTLKKKIPKTQSDVLTEITENCLERLLLAKAFCLEEFLLHLKSLGFMLGKNKFNKVVIIDGANVHALMKEDRSKRVSSSMGLNRKLQNLIHDSIGGVHESTKAALITTYMDPFKNKSVVYLDKESKDHLLLSPKLTNLLSRATESNHKILYFLSYDSFDEDALVYVMEKINNERIEFVLLKRPKSNNVFDLYCISITSEKINLVDQFIAYGDLSNN